MRSFITSVSVIALVGIMVASASTSVAASERDSVVASASTSLAASSERDLVENLCQQMEVAYQSQDQQAIIDLYEGLGSRGAKQLERLFKVSESVSIELEFDRVNASGTEATALMTHVSLVQKRGTVEVNPQQEYHLRKLNGKWKFVTPAYLRK